MKTNKPTKKHGAPKTIGSEHLNGLLLSWKIRAGIKNNIELNRIKTYADWFYTTHLIPHFEAEEKYLFPILGNEHELIKKAISEHRRLKRLFETEPDLLKALSLIEEKLESLIRFEERVLFIEIQKKATQEQLLSFEQISKGRFVDNLTDIFWE